MPRVLLYLLFALSIPPSSWDRSKAHAQEGPGDLTAGEDFTEAALTSEEWKLVRAAQAARIRAIEQVYGSVVAVYGNDRQGGGSGVLFDRTGWALTNHHVVAAAGSEGWAGLADGELYRWKLVGTDPGGDVAIIQLQGRNNFPTAPLADSNRVRVGQWAMAMGNPFVLAEDHRPTVTLGIVSGVERFQEGAGNNMLVYGNCIQVDSSISPGNSGGPLFNLAGEVIGINGRGSFEERGRVNVGLGYAISANQVRNFIPDLLATKVAQHGTLDAVFANRRSGVICERMNLDGVGARGGLQLGDRLVAFEGQTISNANQLTNLLSTYPAGWPAELVVARGETQHTLRIRLAPLPYGPVTAESRQREEPPPRDEPGERDAEPTEKDVAEGESPPSERRPNAPSAGAELNLGRAGAISDERLNAANAERYWELCRGESATRAFAGMVQLEAAVVEREVETGRLRTWLAADGRWRVEHAIRGQVVHIWGFDGETHWTHAPSQQDAAAEIESPRPTKVCSNPAAQQAIALSAWLTGAPLSTGKGLRIEAGDKAAGRLACRFRALTSDGDEWYLWLAVPAPAGVDSTPLAGAALLKTGLTLEGEGVHPALLYQDWREEEGLALPRRVVVARGLAEYPLLEYRMEAVNRRDSVEDVPFTRPRGD